MTSATSPTPRWIAFLRAINVGGRNIKMDRLRSLFEACGFDHVETFIASGNVIFKSHSCEPRALERQIERCLYESLGYRVDTFVRSQTELATVAAYRPFPPEFLEGEGNILYIAFLREAPGSEACQVLLARQTEVDRFHLHEREVYWLCRRKLGESTFSGAQLEKSLGIPATLRNATTVRKLAAKYSGRDHDSELA